jgi:hypothetical protein
VSTQFIQATNKKTGFKSMLHDTDGPTSLFVELAKKNSNTGETMEDWDFALLNSRGATIKRNFDWRKIRVTVSLGDLYR